MTPEQAKDRLGLAVSRLTSTGRWLQSPDPLGVVQMLFNHHPRVGPAEVSNISSADALKAVQEAYDAYENARWASRAH